MTGLQAESVPADVEHREGPKVDDNIHVLLRYGCSGAGSPRGMLWANQVAPGNENNLKLRVYGSKGGLEMASEHPNQLYWSPLGRPVEILSRGTSAVNARGGAGDRASCPAIPRAISEGFAAIYSEVASAIRCSDDGSKRSTKAVMFPVSTMASPASRSSRRF